MLDSIQNIPWISFWIVDDDCERNPFWQIPFLAIATHNTTHTDEQNSLNPFEFKRWICILEKNTNSVIPSFVWDKLQQKQKKLNSKLSWILRFFYMHLVAMQGSYRAYLLKWHLIVIKTIRVLLHLIEKEREKEKNRKENRTIRRDSVMKLLNL